MSAEEVRRLEEQHAALMAELQHRTRNLLGVVRAMARRTLPADEAFERYDARLAALGRAQGALARGEGWSASLHDLVHAEMDAVGADRSGPVRVEGPPVTLPVEVVPTLALALHELATNADRHGALRQAGGRLSVTWRVEGEDGSRRLVLGWREGGLAPPPGTPRHRGYGTDLLERGLAYQLGAETRIEHAPDGVSCTISLPLPAEGA
ncbi:sensor histidine kinase [Roseomonas chloroacetimidivorans]|uniref:sensor histidine kinase n=1 Tax=Roseomonas chloroacetimidivorans TaxID=1766656 RepID=UPI003C78A70C